VTPEQIAAVDARAREIVGKPLGECGWEDLQRLLGNGGTRAPEPDNSDQEDDHDHVHVDAYGDKIEVKCAVHKDTGERYVVLNGDLDVYHFTPTAARELAEDLLDAAEAMEQRFIEIPGGEG